MSNGYGRIIGAQINSMRHSFGALVGLAEGMLCDGVLSDDEVKHLEKWFRDNEQLQYAWPGDVVYDRVKEVLKDGVVTEDERNHLVKILRDLIGTPNAELEAKSTCVTELAYDTADRIDFPENHFCLTGEFVHGPRSTCERDIKDHGGIVVKAVSKKLNYLVIGSLGSMEWKHGSFGSKIDRAMKYKRERIPIVIIKEDFWREALRRL